MVQNKNARTLLCGASCQRCWAMFVTELRAADKSDTRAKFIAAATATAAAQPLGSCKMRSPIMFFCTGEVPPAIVMLSL